MAKLTGFKKFKISIFISGRGSNLKNLIRYSLEKRTAIKIFCVVSNNVNAKGLSIAKKYKIKNKIYRSETQILNYLNKNKIDLICLAGFMKILSKNFIKNFKGRIINIHPSLLPKYKGLNTHQRVIDNKEKISGCTVHFVSPKLDSGKIILQRIVKISIRDNSKTLAKKILKQEHILYPEAIKKLAANL